MGNSVTVTTAEETGDIDASAFVARAKADRNSSSSASDARYATQVVLNSGEAPSYGFIGIPINEFGDEQAPAVALKKSGVVGRIPPNSRVGFDFVNGSKSKTVLTGTLVQYVHVIGEDSAMGLVFDDKWLLGKITVFGRATFDPRTPARYYFDAGTKCVFNELGYPNCLDTPHGPRFAPCHRFGYGKTDFTEPEKGSAQLKARSWTVADIMEYLRDMHYVSDGNQRPRMNVDYGTNVVPHWISWPKGLGNVFNDSRAVMDFDIDNQSLLRAVSMTLRKAGAYDLYCDVQGDYNSTLKVVNMNPPTESGNVLIMPDFDSSYTIADLANSSSVIHSGYINESIINYFHETTIVGDPVCVERFVTTARSADTTTITGMPTASLGGLEPAWDRGFSGSTPIPIGTPAAEDSDEWEFLNYIQNHPSDANSSISFHQATLLWPEVFALYRVPLDYNVWQGTKWDGYHNQTYARIRPALLTGDNQNSGNPANWLPKPVVVEFESEKNTGVWDLAQRFNSLELLPDGRAIRFESLRDSKQTWLTDTGSAYEANVDGSKMQPCHIRLSCVMESDWLITGRATNDPNGTGARVGGDVYTYLTVAGPLQYIEWLRYKSHPNGGNSDMGGGIPVANDVFADKATDENELFSDRSAQTGSLPRHATVRQKDVRRVEYTGQLVQQCLNPSLRPGMAVSLEGADLINVFSVIKSVTYDAATQTTIIDLACADSHHIYDIPVPGVAKVSSGTGGSPAKPATPDYSDSKNVKVESDTSSPSEKSNSAQSSSNSTSTSSSGQQGASGEGGPRGSNGDGEKSMVEKQMMSRLARDNPAAPTGAAAESAPQKRGQILQGDALARKDQQAKTFGKEEAGIMSPESTRAQDDEMKGRHYGQGGGGTNETAQEKRRADAAAARQKPEVEKELPPKKKEDGPIDE